MELPELPPRLYTSDVLKLCRFSHGTLRKKQVTEGFPQPVDRGKQNIYKRDDILEALGLIEPQRGINHNDPFIKGAERLGKIKGR
jgi:hypothetical protein